ncbi:MAG: phosphoribosylglycinamide formyltransferase [Arenicellales bacterium]|jgi:phosphoribosylglycinamide formyltransferase-1
MGDSDMPIVVLISGEGSNLQVLIDEAAAGKLPVCIRTVISNRAGARGLERAARAGIPTHVVDHRRYRTSRDFCQALADCIDRYSPRLVVLAGFMRILDSAFVAHYAGRLINLHPSLLPRYPGLDTHRRVLDNRDTVHGASVHFVTDELDAGPVIAQGRVAVGPDDTPDTLQRKVREVEHRILPTAVRWFAQDRLSLEDGRVLLDGETRPEQELGSAGRSPLAAATSS